MVPRHVTRSKETRIVRVRFTCRRAIVSGTVCQEHLVLYSPGCFVVQRFRNDRRGSC
ncbi:hypothetical protein Isop_0748 [Isosphaera pallida ATCC 43644]|uniref:Uncharacterized protein n=1 Tax=Isosphaera pallida (strain ATCC 43644 / DSM 9630 / IS1B) TaxID=575540 RepID=E8R1R7_ISOPI|nr:hypothetical protein Isop_0748 [Isosphaera pallida ATCC 43644]